MLTAFSVTYRIMLVLALLLSFLANIMVGTAGHTSDAGTSDYIFIGYCIITTVTLTIYAKAKSCKLKQAFRVINLLLVLVGISVTGYGVYEMLSENDFIFQMAIPIVLFIITGLLLFWALVKDKS